MMEIKWEFPLGERLPIGFDVEVYKAWRASAPPGGVGDLLFPGVALEKLLEWLRSELQNPEANGLLLGAGACRIGYLPGFLYPRRDVLRLRSEIDSLRCECESRMERESRDSGERDRGFAPLTFDPAVLANEAARCGVFSLGYALGAQLACAQARHRELERSAARLAGMAIRKAMAV